MIEEIMELLKVALITFLLAFILIMLGGLYGF